MGKKDDLIVSLRQKNSKLSADLRNTMLRLQNLEGRFKALAESKKKLVAEKEDEINTLHNRIKMLEADLDAHKKRFAITTNDDVNLPSNSELAGGIKTSKSIVLGNNTVVDGDLICGSNLTLGDELLVRGSVKADGSVKIGSKNELGGKIVCNKDVTIGSNCIIKEIIAEDKVKIGENSVIEKIVTGGSLELSDGVTVKGGIEYVGSITIGEHVNVEGTIRRREKLAVPVEKVEKIEKKAETRICDACKTPLDISATVCISCGKILGKRVEPPIKRKKAEVIARTKRRDIDKDKKALQEY